MFVGGPLSLVLGVIACCRDRRKAPGIYATVIGAIFSAVLAVAALR
jgi:hypothetical protein